MSAAGTSSQAATRTAIIIGASSGIGEALARELASRGWRLGLMARRTARLEEMACELGGDTRNRHIDLTTPDVAASALERFMADLGGVDLVVVSSATGQMNPKLEWAPDRDTLTVNVLGFAAVAQAAMRCFLQQRRGHLVGISSIAGLRGIGNAAAYSASKAFVSIYLDSLRDVARHSHLPIVVTEVQPGFVATPMMQAKRAFWVATAETAAGQIARAIERRRKHVYVTRRWGLIAALLRLLPRAG